MRRLVNLRQWMFLVCRSMLILSVMAAGYCACIFVLELGGLAVIGLIVLVFVTLARRRHGSGTAFGTARWADAFDLWSAGMLGASRGPILGRVTNAGRAPLRLAIGNLFNLRVSSRAACEQVLALIRFGRRFLRHSLPANVRGIGGRRRFQGREFPIDCRTPEANIRTPHRRARSVSDRVANARYVQSSGVHPQ